MHATSPSSETLRPPPSNRNEKFQPMLINGPEPMITSAPEATQVRDSSQARLPCLAFVADDETEAALRIGLLNIVEGVEVRQGTILHAIKYLTKSPTPRALIVDISKVASPLAELDNLARVCTPDVKLMVVGEDENISFYRELRNMGVAEYMHKPLTRSTVTRVFAPQIAGAATNASVGARRQRDRGMRRSWRGRRNDRRGQSGIATGRIHPRTCRPARPSVAEGHDGADARRQADQRAAHRARATGARGCTLPRPSVPGDQRTIAAGRRRGGARRDHLAHLGRNTGRHGSAAQTIQLCCH